MSDAERARHIVDAAAVGVPIAEWLALPTHTRAAVIEEHNSRIEER